MARTAYPVAADITAHLGTIPGLPSYISGSYSVSIDSAVAEFERRTGYTPFLAEDTDSTQRFSAGIESGDCVNLPSGYASITSIRCYVTADSQGTLLVEGTDYELFPKNAPYEVIKFTGRRCFGFNDLQVIGKKGYSATVPDDVFMAIIQKVSAPAYNYADQSQGGVADKVKQGPVEITFAKSMRGDGLAATSGRAADAFAYFDHVCKQYQRSVIF